MTADNPSTECGTLFRMRFTSTPRGARLARRLTAERLDTWRVLLYGTPASRAVELIVGELCANAVRHGSVRGRDFELGLLRRGDVLRIEVSDARDEQFPPTEVRLPPVVAEFGYGLVLVAAFASRWGTVGRVPVGKTVWAELNL
ncbi:ATP-binding protein [Streptomyces sp. 549]|uniref:ATP-binding protein n=1 Tax=Streptomyces sp. 549 TaxID=3049076 RepID=UPI0024C26F01|nr:ATP-binding protein [Streptomyces sp. 549]MDK1475440.1 ATP-binding protein [Streptomyces sp. 549]